MINRLTSLKNSINAILGNHVALRWSKNAETQLNFGDAINPDLFSKVTNKDVIYYKDCLDSFLPEVYFFIGSNLDNLKTKNAIICGSGFKSGNSKIIKKPKKVIAVRGPLSRQILIDNKVDCPKVYCDPGLLVSKFYPQMGIKKTTKIGIIPHYVDVPKLQNVSIIDHNLSYRILDILAPREEFLKSVNECEYIVSSSLHGVITAHSYGIPALWMILSDKIIGGEFKFQDYYQSLGEFNQKPYRIETILDLNTVLSDAQTYSFESNTSNFLEAMSSHFS